VTVTEPPSVSLFKMIISKNRSPRRPSTTNRTEKGIIKGPVIYRNLTYTSNSESIDVIHFFNVECSKQCLLFFVVILMFLLIPVKEILDRILKPLISNDVCTTVWLLYSTPFHPDFAYGSYQRIIAYICYCLWGTLFFWLSFPSCIIFGIYLNNLRFKITSIAVVVYSTFISDRIRRWFRFL